MSTVNNEILDADQVAEILHTHKRRVCELSCAGEIPATKVGRKWIYSRTLIEEWLIERARLGPEKIKQKQLEIAKGFKSSILKPEAFEKQIARRERRINQC